MHIPHPSSPGYVPPAALRAAPGSGPFGGDGLQFGDLVDLVNPLHHLPVIGQIYRRISGDAIDPALRVAGGALFGGPLGAAFATAGLVVDAAFERGPAGPAPAQQDTALAHGQRPARPPIEASAPATRRMPRRGGWMAAAAYAMADERAAAGQRLRTVA